MVAHDRRFPNGATFLQNIPIREIPSIGLRERKGKAQKGVRGKRSPAFPMLQVYFKSVLQKDAV